MIKATLAAIGAWFDVMIKEPLGLEKKLVAVAEALPDVEIIGIETTIDITDATVDWKDAPVMFGVNQVGVVSWYRYHSLNDGFEQWNACEIVFKIFAAAWYRQERDPRVDEKERRIELIPAPPRMAVPDNPGHTMCRCRLPDR